MRIKQLKIKNFKSFGNIEQVLDINSDKGELILLAGGNGKGKSSILESFEYTLFGKVKSSKKKKWTPLSTLPNRINGDLLNTIEFEANGVDIKIERGYSPSILRLYENGIENEKAGKVNIDKIIEEYAGMDIETFKSFISMSINDFKNFISLSSEEKQLLLDKLFNLEIINELNSILKGLVSTNKKDIIKYDTEIESINDSINQIKFSINKTISNAKKASVDEIEAIKNDILSKKDIFLEMKDKLSKIEKKELEIKSLIDKDREQLLSIKNEINNINKEINLFNSGKCPTCSTDFIGDYYDNIKIQLEEKLLSIKNIGNEINSSMLKYKERQDKLLLMKSSINDEYNNIQIFLGTSKSKLKELESKLDDKSDDIVKEFNKSIKQLESKMKISSNFLDDAKDKELYYKQLSKIFSEDGVKKSIISGIVKPINMYIKHNIDVIGLPFSVVLDDTFTATIKSIGSEIEQDSLSTGENKMINICIMLAYLNLIRTKKYINILFLDEVFASIDTDNIDRILELLRVFSTENKVNIFVVHHILMKEELFDRIINVNKNVFSTINEINMLSYDLKEKVIDEIIL